MHQPTHRLLIHPATSEHLRRHVVGPVERRGWLVLGSKVGVHERRKGGGGGSCVGHSCAFLYSASTTCASTVRNCQPPHSCIYKSLFLINVQLHYQSFPCLCEISLPVAVWTSHCSRVSQDCPGKEKLHQDRRRLQCNWTSMYNITKYSFIMNRHS